MKVAVVTGASSGIGKAIAARLLDEGMKVYAVNRSGNIPNGCEDVRASLTCWSTLENLIASIKEHKRLDVLVHGAGMFYSGSDRELIETQSCVNAHAPQYLSRALLPYLTEAKGQVVFLNSLAGLRVKQPRLAAYGESKRMLKEFADLWRSEVNPKGIRVLSIFLGKVATPMQEVCYREEGKPYHPERLMQPEEVASAIFAMLSLPRTAEATDLTLRSMTV